LTHINFILTSYQLYFNVQGSFLRSHTIESTFGKESQDQQKQTPIVKTKLSNLPEDTDTEFLELFLEQELGNGIDIISIELCKNGTEAIIEFENKNGMQQYICS
jgi:hypothetical protein